ncbi:MAG: MarR family transcriptional regulator [Alicyclobacillaceae bacterium]|uniref:MarR family winged helix-turn-helix transcriptional regulator n=1 Tax=Alicyclobacillus sp. SP_1 TaxID=2942475 RepID=UPI002157E3A7|nr:MarR family transcriptional regulator [Alicyclobacillus sp. SP_1]MCY0888839.1 MarR family transcriptional regulator [Alicyclobacillaceae bacterium]MCY0897105.1 MarR family transcriptional regulator [Alicyclobacillaceae bacterium]
MVIIGTKISSSMTRTLEDLMTRMIRVSQTHSPIKKFNITPTQAYLLRHLHADGRTKASQLARVVGLSPGAVTQVCDELVRMKYVERVRSQEDRRVVYHEITEQGLRILESLQTERCAFMAELLSELGPDDAKDFIRILDRVVQYIESMPLPLREHVVGSDHPPRV